MNPPPTKHDGHPGLSSKVLHAGFSTFVVQLCGHNMEDGTQEFAIANGITDEGEYAAQEPLQPSKCRGNKVVSGLKVMRYLPPMGNLRATFELWGKFRLSFHRFWGEREEARRCGTGGSRRKRKLRGRGRTEVEAMGGMG
ncbi:hypothetical protein RIF29_24965 [Crotalaria pallida]|uniref:Uncharacterized protein n=1 Tax=Crotalaria pallida TaxID=3830 RepID=A0AAN9HZD5_CROPI